MSPFSALFDATKLLVIVQLEDLCSRSLLLLLCLHLQFQVVVQLDVICSWVSERWMVNVPSGVILGARHNVAHLIKSYRRCVSVCTNVPYRQNLPIHHGTTDEKFERPKRSCMANSEQAKEQWVFSKPSVGILTFLSRTIRTQDQPRTSYYFDLRWKFWLVSRYYGRRTW